MSRQACRALLIDLDGVLRVFDPRQVAEVERRHGLPEGLVVATAFAEDRLRPALTGQVSHEEWMAGVAEALAPQVGGADAARAAVAEWSGFRGRVQPQVREFVGQLRAAGVPVALATNATDWLDADLKELGLRGAFDAVVNSSDVGCCKPSREFFHVACEAVGVSPEECLLVDDDDRNVRGARAAGLSAYRHTDPVDLRYVRAALRVPV